MKYRITGNYGINLCGGITRIPGALFDLIVDAPSADEAARRALAQALASYPVEDAACPHQIGWTEPPEVTELPADEANRLLGEDVAPRLPGL